MCAASGTVVPLGSNTKNHIHLRHYTTKMNHGTFQGRSESSRMEAV